MSYKEPTIKQRMAFDRLAENGGNISKTMRQVGYSAVTAHKPEKLTSSKGWQKLMKTYLPDSKLAAIHQKLLKKQEAIVVSDGAKEGSHIEWTGQPHTDALKALDLAYKLKKHYPTDDEGNNKVVIINISGQSANRYGTNTVTG